MQIVFAYEDFISIIKYPKIKTVQFILTCKVLSFLLYLKTLISLMLNSRTIYLYQQVKCNYVRFFL